MSKILINLLPPEVTAAEKGQKKRTLLFKAATGVLLIVLITTSSVLTKRFYQNQEVEKVNQQLLDAQSKVASMKDKEGLAFFLKQRLSSIEPLLSQESKQAQSFNLISVLTPPSVKVLFFTSDKNGNITLSVVAPSTDNIRQLFDNLVNPQINQGKIKSVEMDSLSRAADNLYRMDLKISTI